MHRRVEKQNGYSYLLHLPAEDPDGRLWPLILFLHGVGERGDDLERLKAHGIPRVVENRPDFPMICISPQCPHGQTWSVPRLARLLEEALVAYRIDPDRVCLTGLSMGGYGTWAFAIEQPHRFAAIAPICGGGDPRKAGRLRRVPVWVFHGALDPIVPLRESARMVEALERCGADVRFTVYSEAAHDSWTEAYDNPELYAWFSSHRRKRAGRPSGSD